LYVLLVDALLCSVSFSDTVAECVCRWNWLRASDDKSWWYS